MNKNLSLLGGILAAMVLALSLSACSSGANADNVLGVGTNTGGTGSGTITAGNGNTGGNSAYATISGTNTQAVTVYDPTFYYGYVNEPMVSVTICVPGSTTSCETIPDILLDTASYGLRLIASTVSLALPGVQVNSNPIAECAQFADAYDWGPVVQADVKLGDGSAQHTASSVSIQLMGSSSYTSVPTSCAGTGLTETDTVATFGANGVLGVGVFAQDCGSTCATMVPSTPVYYSCPSGAACTAAEVATSSQVANPVRLMPADNNGIIVSLPSISTTTGASTVPGTLVLGIGTAANNGLGGAQTYTTDANGNFKVTYNSIGYPGSFLDTGSNAFYILDGTTLGLADCASGTAGDGFYCPANTTNLSVTTTGANSTSSTVGFSIANATLLANTGSAVFNDIGAPYGAPPEEFDLGLPFFLGRNVYVGFESLTSPGTGMYWAY